jgi:hypothetical protein
LQTIFENLLLINVFNFLILIILYPAFYSERVGWNIHVVVGSTCLQFVLGLVMKMDAKEFSKLLLLLLDLNVNVSGMC